MIITLKPINTKKVKVTIVGTSILVQHKFSEKALKQIRDAEAGRKTKDREARNPAKDAEEALHKTADGRYGIPAVAIKACIVNSAHKDYGIEKTLVRKSLFIECKDTEGNLPIRCKEPKIREDWVRVGNDGVTLRYRPEFASGWECDIEIIYDSDNLQSKDIVNLLNRAGFGVGLLEFRPEKGGDWGRFEVKTK